MSCIGMQQFSSKTLDATVAQLRRTSVPSVILTCGVTVTPEQLETAAGILGDIDSIVISNRDQVRDQVRDNESSQERPGFIDKPSQTDPKILVFAVGTLPMSEYRIATDGRLLGKSHVNLQREVPLQQHHPNVAMSVAANSVPV